MIRDKNRIYGEMNDPRTVIAEKFLEENKFVVGAGNRGVKTYVPKTKNSILVVRNGVLEEFPLSGQNKLVGSNSYGELEFLDMKQTIKRYRSKMDSSSLLKSAIVYYVSDVVGTPCAVDFTIDKYFSDVAGREITSPIYCHTGVFKLPTIEFKLSVKNDVVTVTSDLNYENEKLFSFEPAKIITMNNGTELVVNKDNESLVYFMKSSNKCGAIARFDFQDGIKIKASDKSKLYISFSFDVRNTNIDPQFSSSNQQEYISSRFGQNDIFSIGRIELTNENGDNIILLQENFDIPITVENIKVTKNRGYFSSIVELDIGKVSNDISLDKLHILFRKVNGDVFTGYVDLNVGFYVTVCQVIGDEDGNI